MDSQLILIEVNNIDDANLIPIKRGNIFHITSQNTFIYDDINLNRVATSKIIKENILSGTESDKIYVRGDNRFFKYDDTSKSYIEIFKFYEILVIINGINSYKPILLSMNSNGKEENIAPVSFTNIVYRTNGENLENFLNRLDREIINDSSKYKVIYTDATSGKDLPVPVPSKLFLKMGGGLAVYLNGKFIENDKYIIDPDTNMITFIDYPNGLPLNSKIEFGFMDKQNTTSIERQRFISEKNQTEFKLNFLYTIGINSVSVYINGIKQPNECYEETTSNIITLKDIIPERSEVVIECGRIVPSEPNFFDELESRVIQIVDNCRIIKFQKDLLGRFKTIKEYLNNNGDIVTRELYLNDILLTSQSFTYDNDTISINIDKF